MCSLDGVKKRVVHISERSELAKIGPPRLVRPTPERVLPSVARLIQVTMIKEYRVWQWRSWSLRSALIPETPRSQIGYIWSLYRLIGGPPPFSMRKTAIAMMNIPIRATA